MDNLILKVAARSKLGKGLRIGRKRGLIPAVLYGRKITNQNLEIDENGFLKVFEKAGENTLVDLAISDQPVLKVLIQSVQKDPVTDRMVHIDFYQVDMAQEINTEVELTFTGESKAEKMMGGILVTAISKIPIRCLPGDLIHEIKVDISGLENFDDVIRVSDLNLPDNIKLELDPEDVLVNVVPPRSDEELKELDEEVKEVIPSESEAEGAEKAEGKSSPEKQEVKTE